MGAPPADLMAVLKSADGTLLTGVLGYAINGLLANNPSLGPILDAQVNAKGKDALAKVSTQCIGDTILSFGYAKTTDWTVSGKSAFDVVNSIPAAKAIADKQKLGTVKPRCRCACLPASRTTSSITRRPASSPSTGATVRRTSTTRLSRRPSGAQARP